jgi:hypothetical protein
VFPREIALTLIVSNYIFKVAIETLFTPFTYTIVKRLKQTEHVDHYDYETNFNPFHLGAA